MGRVVEGIVERLLDSNEIKLQNSGVSKLGSHDTIAIFPHITLQISQFLSHDSGEIGQEIFEAFIMQKE